MPFKKVGKDDYTGPSGRHFDLAQVKLYYAHGGSFPGQHQDRAAAEALSQRHPKSRRAPDHPHMA